MNFREIQGQQLINSETLMIRGHYKHKYFCMQQMRKDITKTYLLCYVVILQIFLSELLY